MMNKLILTALAVLGAVHVAPADTLVVDKTGADGAYTTIQAAISAAEAGDTIFVKAGVYETGSTTDGFSTPMENRVYVNKSVKILGESREQTIIKGARATTGVDSYGLGCGSNAVRCIGINADNVVISNLTVTGGATHNSSDGNDKEENNGGGVYALNGKTGIVIVDCIISNNIARRAAALRYGNDNPANHSKCLLVRTWIHENKALDGGYPIVRGCLAAHCLFTRHYSSSHLDYAATYVNCTFADGYGRHHSGSANVSGYNCIFTDSWYKDDGSANWYNCAFNKQDATTTSTTNLYCVFNPGYDLYMAPPLVDYRLHDGATAVIGKGDAGYLDLLPEAYRYTDFYGHAFTSDSVNMGCSQETVTPTGGTITFAGQTGMSAVTPTGNYGATTDCGLYFFNGMPVGASKLLGYIRTMAGRTIVTVAHDPAGATGSGREKGLHSFAASGADTMHRFALMDGSFVLMAPPAGKTVTLAPNFNASVLYVDRNSTAEPPDGSAEAPYTSIQAAINAVVASAYATIYVKEGVYDNDTGMYANHLTNRVHSNGRYVRLVSSDGIGKAVILGAPDPSVALDAWPFGCGYGALRCAFLQQRCAIQGFALTGGYSNTDADSTGKRGAALWLDGGAQALDCVITNNVGYQGVAINGSETVQVPSAFAHRCYIADNYPINTTTSAKTGGQAGMIRSTTIGSSIVYNNHGNNFGSYERQYSFHTTFADGEGADNGHLINSSYNVNDVVLATYGALNAPTMIGGVYKIKTGAVSGSSTSVVNADPLIADPARGDFRLAATSPARDYGVTAHDDFQDSTKAAYYMFGATDFGGRIFRLKDGKPVCGALDRYAATVVLNGETHVLAEGETAFTYTCTSDDKHPFLGLEITADGVVTTNATRSYTFNLPAQEDYPEAYALTILDLFDPNWYVNAATGDDTYAGTEAQPKKTLKGALIDAVSGDTVHVAAGVYASETMTQPKRFSNVTGAGYDHLARAVIPAGVTVLGAGAETTFIVGASDPSAIETDNGCGPNAVRCVAIEKGAKLSGFTLTGGRTDADGNDDNFHGGGVLAEYGTEATMAVVADCIISNCVGRRGGGGFHGVYNRCWFLDNSVISGGNGSAVRGNGLGNCYLYNCLIDRCDGYATVYFPTCMNCTFGADNSLGGAKDGITLIVDAGDIRNCLILGDKNASGQTNAVGEVTHTKFYNCVMSPQTEAYLSDVSRKVYVDASCIVTDNLAIDADYAPVIGGNAAVDVADKTVYDTVKCGTTDVYGHPRFVNGLKLDIGAVESDWLAAYSQKLGSSVTVTAADPAVELVETGVKIPAEASLAFDAATIAGSRYGLLATLAEGGTLAVQKDGTDWLTVTDSGEYNFRAAGSHTTLDFVMGPVGYGVLSRFHSTDGTSIVIR